MNIRLFYNKQNKGTKRPLWSNKRQDLGLEFAVWIDQETKNLALSVNGIPPKFRKEGYQNPMIAAKSWIPQEIEGDDDDDIPF